MAISEPTMTLDDAIECARKWEWRAQEDFPMGYDKDAFRREMGQVLAVIEREEKLVPERARVAWARDVRERIERKHFVATVQPRRRKVMA